MRLSPGTRVGAYDIIAAVGAGGMGEVYKARDVRLNRTVAIKVLTSSLDQDLNFRARFQREAQAIATLQHPNICVLHDVGESDGAPFLVMEYLEGQTLQARLENGPLSLLDALHIGTQIAGALGYAHGAGIVHRDLKPGNIMLTASGAKLLDFGLARVMRDAAGDGSLTLTQTAALSGMAAIMGTLPYMSPEQLEGKPADARSDIFSLGAVLYEAISGQRAFEGRTQASLIAAILSSEPTPIATTRTWDVPIAPVEYAIAQCLKKVPADRWQNASDVALMLKGLADSPAIVGQTFSPRRRISSLVGWAVAAAALIGVVMVTMVGRPSSTPPPLISLSVTLSPNLFVEVAPGGTSLALSPDGSALAFVGRSVGRVRLFLRRLDRFDTIPLPGTDDAYNPFFSPDGKWVGFFTSDAVKRVSIDGGTPTVICAISEPEGGAEWQRDGTIIFGGGRAGLMRVSAPGGVPQTLTHVDVLHNEIMHRGPLVLPGDRTFLYTVWFSDKTGGKNRVDAQSLSSGERRTVLADGDLLGYVSGAGLVFAQGSRVMAARFDPQQIALTSEPAPVLDSVMKVAVTRSGMLAYLPGAEAIPEHTLVWVNHQGREQPISAPPRPYETPRLSPDGRRIATAIRDGNEAQIWTYDLSRSTLTRLTSGGTGGYSPFWTPDGARLVFNSIGTGSFDLYSGERRKRASRATRHALPFRSFTDPGWPSALLRWSGKHEGTIRYLGHVGRRARRAEAFRGCPLHPRRAASIPQRQMVGVCVRRVGSMGDLCDWPSRATWEMANLYGRGRGAGMEWRRPNAVLSWQREDDERGDGPVSVRTHNGLASWAV